MRCETFTPTARFGLLHELAHVWLEQFSTEELRSAFLNATGLTTWGGAEAPWHQRGVEYAAEVLAHGLMDENVTLVRLGSPPCDQTRAGFTLLTGAVPLVGCPVP